MSRRSRIWGVGSALFCSLILVARGQSGAIQEIINGVSLDSLATTVRVLSGEAGSRNGGSSDTIHSRWYANRGNTLAVGYLEQRLKDLHLVTWRHEFSGPLAPGINVLAEQTGELFPLETYILCAHLDATNYDNDSLAPGADDNASGCAAVLEAARLISRYRTAYTVLYAFWNHEEIGSIGSNRYAREARARDDSILGVLNLDMLGYDADNDSTMNVHTSPIGYSTQLADTVAFINRLYNIGLRMRILNPGISGSDHGGFWRQGYSAILIIEGLSGGDFSPYNHKNTDVLEHINLSYFHRLAKLSTASAALVAGILGPLGVPRAAGVSPMFYLAQNYPNPFNPTTAIRYSLPHRSHVTLTVFNTLGQLVATLMNGEVDAGSHEMRFDARNLASGVYFYRMQAGGYVDTKKFCLVR